MIRSAYYLLVAAISVVAIAYVGGLSLHAQQGDKAVLSFVISTNKSTYLEGEEVFLLTYRTNTTKDKISVIRLFESDESAMVIEVIDAKGRILPRTVSGTRSGPLMDRDSLTLEPGATQTDWFHLAGLFGKALNPGVILGFEPGTYRAQATYRHWWNDEYSSNEIEFTVKAPEGAERDAWELWTSADSLRLATGNRDAAIQRYREFLARYPNSVYSPRVCSRAMLASQRYIGGEPDNSKEWAERLMTDYPESYDVDLAMTVYIGNAKGADRETILRNLMAKYKGSRVEGLAGKRIQMWREFEGARK